MSNFKLHLIRNYCLYPSMPTSRRPTTVFSDSSTIPTTMNTVVSSFHQEPFRLSTESTTVSINTLFGLNENSEVAEQVTAVFRKQGDLWVKRNIVSDSIDELSRIQRITMELLSDACIPQMESEILKFARSGDGRVSNASLKDLTFGLRSAIARAKAQSFSIAFCGMVKAG